MYELPKLDYEYNALEPFIDEKTMIIHHTKHHQAYLDKLLGAIKGTEFEKISPEVLIAGIDKLPEDKKTIVRNNGGGFVNHNFFWKLLGKTGTQPGPNFMKVAESFGGMEKLKEQFNAAAIGRFGSGWAWIVLKNGKYEIMSTANQDSPIMEGKKPVLGVDVWEHAYYLKYQNKRPEYLEAFWNVINWNFVEEQLE
jgi:superoxide dismutase, Fe-Mn family